MSNIREWDLLWHAAQRAAERPAFVASDLAAYREWRHMGEDALAEFLGCTPEQLPRLALCRRPDPSGPDFYSQVERIAAYAGVRADRLAQLFQEKEKGAS